ncbi:energy-coupling factor ABC transporter substrate-binding protein [Trichloromonas sp.]|uniref:energy-coupling factor ABC transporter substrate-binding protein n=1 Tax=Trichloromonas sp. TaxID=3069249 RepID=UPI003D814D27
MSKRWQNVLMILAVIVLVAWPLLTVRAPQAGPGGEPAEIFTGADGQAQGVIRQLAPDYQPWAAPLLAPPSGEIESLLFTLQAVLGAGFIGYYVGVKRERARGSAASGISRAA